MVPVPGYRLIISSNDIKIDYEKKLNFAFFGKL